MNLVKKINTELQNEIAKYNSEIAKAMNAVIEFPVDFLFEIKPNIPLDKIAEYANANPEAAANSYLTYAFSALQNENYKYARKFFKLAKCCLERTKYLHLKELQVIVRHPKKSAELLKGSIEIYTKKNKELVNEYKMQKAEADKIVEESIIRLLDRKENEKEKWQTYIM